MDYSQTNFGTYPIYHSYHCSLFSNNLIYDIENLSLTLCIPIILARLTIKLSYILFAMLLAGIIECGSLIIVFELVFVLASCFQLRDLK